MEDVLLFGGTFNPPHVGHIEIARSVAKKIGIKNIVLIPSGNPPHKMGRDIADANHRVNMLKLAIKNEKNFKISLIEVVRKGYTYTIDTLIELKKKYGEEKRFYYLIGEDVLRNLPTWKDYKDVLLMCKFVVVARSVHTKNLLIKDVQKLTRKYGLNAVVVDVDCVDVSSTKVRELAYRGDDLKGLVSREVLQYIRNNNLYRK